MKDLFRVFTIISLHQLFKHLGNSKINFFVFTIGRFYEILLIPFRRKKHKASNLGEALLKTLYHLGPVYVKFGQTLSTRSDIIGEDIAEYLKQLQDKLPSFSSKKAKDIIEAEFGQKIEEIFSEFDDNPVAAASISQVHKAVLKDGKKVAVKILRPSIEKEYKRDLDFLYYLARIAKYITPDAKRLRPVKIVDVFQNTMKQELDLVMEAASCSEMKDYFKSDYSIIIPMVFWGLTSHKVLTTQWVDGISIYDVDSLEKAGIDTVLVAQKIAIMFFNQAYKNGFFHADLHPGNIMVSYDGRIILVDFGIVGRLPEKDRLAVSEILHAFLKRDYMRIAKIHVNAGYIPPSADVVMFSQACRALGEPIVGVALKNISISKLLGQLFKMTKDFGMEVQPQLLLLQKTTVVVEGIGRQLNSEINMWQLAEPWIKKWAGKNISPEAKLIRELKKLLEDLIDKI